jgi:Fe-Mn family superoxide dismutase
MYCSIAAVLLVSFSKETLMAYELAPLPYAYSALAPVIDEETVHLHHDKHHQTYVNNLNAAVEKHPALFAKSEIELLKNLASVPEDIRTAVKNNGGGQVNHAQYWEIITPGGAAEPVGALAAAIVSTFGSVEEFKTKFNAGGLARFGSGWVWLVSDASGKLSITSSANQDSPLSDGLIPIIGNDVWEHAYYLTYQNRRADYLTAFWKIVNWDIAQARYAAAK